MKKIIVKIISSLLFIIVASCGNNYYGYDKQTWDQMSQIKKDGIRKEMEAMAKEIKEIRSEIKGDYELMQRAGKY